MNTDAAFGIQNQYSSFQKHCFSEFISEENHLRYIGINHVRTFKHLNFKILQYDSERANLSKNV